MELYHPTLAAVDGDGGRYPGLHAGLAGVKLEAAF